MQIERKGRKSGEKKLKNLIIEFGWLNVQRAGDPIKRRKGEKRVRNSNSSLHHWIIPCLVASFMILPQACDENPSDSRHSSSGGLTKLHTEGRWIKNNQGEKVLLRGVNIPGLEWDANESHVIQSFNVAVYDWGFNLVRLPLCQDRWYGYSDEQNGSSVRYRALVDDLAERALKKKVYIWLDLHWSDAGLWGQFDYVDQHIMPDLNSLEFWLDVAQRYKNHPAVLFGLYNEPYGVSWGTWRDGGTVIENFNRGGRSAVLTYEAVGHQRLVNEIRALGAENIVIAAGLDWGYDLSGILRGYKLEGENIVYDTHPYPQKDASWDYRWGAVGDSLPVIVGEWGGYESDASYFSRLRGYLKNHGFSWAAWCMHASAGPQMIQDWNYTPTYFGSVVRTALADSVDLEQIAGD